MMWNVVYCFGEHFYYSDKILEGDNVVAECGLFQGRSNEISD